MSDRCDYRLDPACEVDGGARATDEESRAADEKSRATDDHHGPAETWECHRDPVDGEDRCPFHLSPDRRRAAGIDDAALRDRLLDAVREGGRRRKQFLGARLDGLDLSHQVVEGADNHPIDLRYATVDGAVDVERATVEQSVDLRHANVDAIDGRDAELADAWLLDEATLGAVSLTGTTFANDLEASGLRVTGETVLDETRVGGDTCFRGARFEGPASLRGAEFRGDANLLDDDVCFEDAVFADDATFLKAEFRYADFEGTTFAADATFAEATFDSDAEFIDVAFGGAADFRGAEFRGGDNVLSDDADFERSTFAERATFAAARFAFADFHEVAFQGEATFADAAFDGDADFRGVEAREGVDFGEARFTGDADFSSVVLAGDVDFTGAEFHGGDNAADEDLSFRDAVLRGPVAFRMARFRFATFEGARFEATADFAHAAFDREGVFSGAVFVGSATFDEGRFDDDADFSEAAFRGDASFRGVEFHGGDNVDDDDLSLADAVFEGEADFRRGEFGETTAVRAAFGDRLVLAGATFERAAAFDEAVFSGPVEASGVAFSGGNTVDDAVSFADATFEDRVDFHRAWVATATFANAAFEGVVAFREAWFDDTTTFEGAAFRDRAVFLRSRFDHDACFADATFAAPTTFRGSEFHGGEHAVDDADFQGATFAATADFKRVEFRYARFDGVHVAADLGFAESVFTGTARFEGVAVDGETTFSGAVFEQEALFADAAFAGPAAFDRIRFDDDTSFAGVRFAGTANFKATEFRGKTNHENDDATFEEATFGGDAAFAQARFEFANFSGVTVHGAANFQDVRFRELGAFDRATFHDEVTFERARFQFATFDGVTFAAPADFKHVRFVERLTMRASSAAGMQAVDMSHAVLAGGRITQPAEDPAVYDLTGATLGEVRLAGDRRDLFDEFRFCNTTFDDFDFTRHKESLARNDWVIHEWVAAESSRFPDVEPVTDPATLESTYLKAKNGAADFGDRKAASEFFIKEMTYRRRKNAAIAFRADGDADGAVDALDRLTAAGKWVGNGVLYQTCGYGERLWRVIYISAIAIVAWGFLYATMTEGTRGASDLTTEGIDGLGALVTPSGLITLSKNLYFSMITFTTLGYGDIQPVGTTARTLAGLESFLGALLLALVVFVLGRRVAW